MPSTGTRNRRRMIHGNEPSSVVSDQLATYVHMEGAKKEGGIIFMDFAWTNTN
jgi:hypothetical protein